MRLTIKIFSFIVLWNVCYSIYTQSSLWSRAATHASQSWRSPSTWLPSTEDLEAAEDILHLRWPLVHFHTHHAQHWPKSSNITWTNEHMANTKCPYRSHIHCLLVTECQTTSYRLRYSSTSTLRMMDISSRITISQFSPVLISDIVEWCVDSIYPDFRIPIIVYNV